LRVEVHGFFARQLRLAPEQEPAGLRFIVLRQQADLASLSPAVVTQLDSQSGAGVRALLERGTKIYALIRPDAVACQLNISKGELQVDSPIPLRILLRDGDAFLTFLYTHPEFRRRGLAELLVRLVGHSLAAEGCVRCLCHIRMTNVPSLATFRRTGWVRVAALVTSTTGRLIGKPGATAAGIALSAG
jgi:ribosomal protein S18 acetylase RimI-like enzyme